MSHVQFINKTCQLHLQNLPEISTTSHHLHCHDCVQTTTASHWDGNSFLTGVHASLHAPYMLAYSVCSQHGSQCNLFIMEVPSLPRAPSNANWIPSQSFQPLSLSTLAFSTAAPWPFHDPFRQQERARAVALVLPLLSSWNQLPIWLQAVLPLVVTRLSCCPLPALALWVPFPQLCISLLHNTCLHLRHPYMSHFQRLLSFMEFRASYI